MDLSPPLARLGRYLDKWIDWAGKELKTHHGTRETHSHGQCDIHHVWQRCVERRKHLDLQRLFASPRSDGGRLIVLAGHNGSTHPVEWTSKGQATTASDHKWGRPSNRAVFGRDSWKKTSRNVEFSRTRHPDIIGSTDNDSLRLAVERGSSTNLGHLRKNGRAKFQFLEDYTDAVGMRGRQRAPRRQFHEKTHRHKATASLLALVHVGCEPQQPFASCLQRRISQTLRNMLVFQPCGYWRLLV